jgi:stage V sporulation protein AE
MFIGIFEQKRKIIFLLMTVKEVFKMEYINAFWVGGLICVVGQILIDKTKLTPARILTGFVVAGVILGAVGLYEPLAEFAGAGASVPISGFGYLMSDGVKEAIKTDGALGILTGGLTSAAGGITAAIFFGLVAAFLTKSKDK